MTANDSTLARRIPEAADRERTRLGLVELVTVALLALAVVALTAVAVEAGLDRGMRWDLDAHAKNAAISNELGIPWGHFLSYVLISAPCGMCADVDRIVATLPLVVGVLLAAKLVITYALLRRAVLVDGRLPGGATVALAAGLAVLVGIAFSLPFPNPYRGQLPPNQWHNTTTFVLMPFALALYWAGVRYLRRPTVTTAGIIAIVGLLSIAAKPNFAMAFIPAFGLAAVLVPEGRRAKLVGAAATLALVAGLGIQYLWMYRSERFATLRSTVLADRGQDPTAEWGIAFAPFEMWSQVTPSILVSTVAMLLFPVAVLVARPRAARESVALQLAWAMFGVALLTFILFTETGRGTGAANFRWGGIATMYVLFVASLALLLSPGARQDRRRDVVAWTAFGAHVVSGLVILYLFVQTTSYLQLEWERALRQLGA